MVKEAKDFLKKTDNDEFEVKQEGEKVVLKKKQSKFAELIQNYRVHFYSILTNRCAMILIIASFFKLWQASTFSLYLNEYMKVYKQEYSIFSAQTSATAFLGGIFATTLSGIIVDNFGPKYEMTIPMICIVKTVLTIPMMIMTFDQ